MCRSRQPDAAANGICSCAVHALLSRMHGLQSGSAEWAHGAAGAEGIFSSHSAVQSLEPVPSDQHAHLILQHAGAPLAQHLVHRIVVGQREERGLACSSGAALNSSPWQR